MVFLSACAANDQPVPPVHQGYNLGAAQAYCLSRGHARGTFDYDSCYQNRPEVQSYERDARLEKLVIINENRSPRMPRGRSVPVE